MIKNLHFVWVTHRFDGGCLIQSVRAILALGVDPSMCWVGQQKGRDLEDKHVEILRAWGVKIFASGYRRTESYADHVSRIRAIIHPGSGWIYNIDSDTIITSLEPALAVMGSDAVAAAATWGTVPFAGCACLMRYEAAKAVYEDLRDKNTLKFPSGPGTVGDDTAHGLLLRHLYGDDRVTKWPVGKGYLKRFHFANDAEQVEDLTAYPAIHFGERKDARELAKGVPVRDVVERYMKQLNDHIEDLKAIAV
jgi:hypothetical protein